MRERQVSPFDWGVATWSEAAKIETADRRYVASIGTWPWYARALRRRLGAPGGEAEARRWRASGRAFGPRFDARPAHEMWTRGVSVRLAVRVYRYAECHGLWARGYGSPYSASVAVIMHGLRRGWTAQQIRIIGEMYNGRRIPRHVEAIAPVVRAVLSGARRLRRSAQDAGHDAWTYTERWVCEVARLHMRSGRTTRSYLAALAALEHACTREDVRVAFRAALRRPMRELLAEYASPQMLWRRLGITVTVDVSARPPVDANARVAHVLAAEAEADGPLGDKMARPIAALLATFGRAALRFVAAARGDVSARAVHDAGQFTPGKYACEAGRYIMAHLRVVVEKRLRGDSGLARELRELIEGFRPEMCAMTWHDAVIAARARTYAGVVGDDIARVAAACGMSVHQARDYAMWLAWHPAKTECELPDVVVTGLDVGLGPEWEFARLPFDDLRGPVLGLITDCCQHPDGAGAACAAHGWTSRYGAFYVVMRQGQIMAQSWAWRAGGAVCFDSIEALSVAYADSILRLYCEAARRIVACGAGIDRVVVGKRSAIDLSCLPKVAKGDRVEPVDYHGYRDSHKQRWLSR